MSLIEIEKDKPEKRRRFPKGLLAIGLISAIASLGLAVGALITLNGTNGAQAELGTGVVTAASCDSDGIIVTPYESFVSQQVTGKFTFNSLDFEGISSNCAGKDFIITIRGRDNNPLPISVAADGRQITSMRIYFQPFTGANDSVSDNGVFANMYSLLGMDSATGLVKVDAIHGLDPTGTPLPVDGNGDVNWNGDNPATYWALNPTDNSFSIVFNPSPVTGGGDQVSGFADSRDSYSITIETLAHSDV